MMLQWHCSGILKALIAQSLRQMCIYWHLLFAGLHLLENEAHFSKNIPQEFMGCIKAVHLQMKTKRPGLMKQAR